MAKVQLRSHCSLRNAATEPPAHGHRGAAKHSACTSPARSPLHLSAFASTRASPKSVKRTSQKPKSSQSAMSNRTKHTHLSSLHLSKFATSVKQNSLQLTQFADSSAAAEPNQSRKLTKATGVEEKHWVCDKCSLILRSTCILHLSAKRMVHIRKHHADLPKDFFHQIQPRQTMIPASHGLSLSTGVWQCAWCDESLPPSRWDNAKHQPGRPKASKQATMSQNVKALLPKPGYDPQARPAQVASLYAKAGRFEEIRHSSPHDLTPVGPMGRHTSFACSI